MIIKLSFFFKKPICKSSNVILDQEGHTFKSQITSKYHPKILDLNQLGQPNFSPSPSNNEMSNFTGLSRDQYMAQS